MVRKTCFVQQFAERHVILRIYPQTQIKDSKRYLILDSKRYLILEKSIVNINLNNFNIKRNGMKLAVFAHWYLQYLRVNEHVNMFLVKRNVMVQSRWLEIFFSNNFLFEIIKHFPINDFTIGRRILTLERWIPLNIMQFLLFVVHILYQRINISAIII